MQNSARPNKKGKHTDTLEYKIFKYSSPTTSASLLHSGGISFVVDFLSQPRKSPIRVCLNKGRK